MICRVLKRLIIASAVTRLAVGSHPHPGAPVARHLQEGARPAVRRTAAARRLRPYGLRPRPRPQRPPSDRARRAGRRRTSRGCTGRRATQPARAGRRLRSARNGWPIRSCRRKCAIWCRSRRPTWTSSPSNVNWMPQLCGNDSTFKKPSNAP